MKAGSIKVLVVDPDPYLLQSTSEALSKAGMVVKTAASSPEATGHLADFKPDVLVLDVGLSLMENFKLSRYLIRNLISVPVILLSALDSLDDQVKGLLAGAQDYVVKPFQQEELITRISIVAQAQKDNAVTPAGLPPYAVDVVPADGLVAGDFYDIMPLDEHTLGFYMADVSGHGPVAGVRALQLRYHLRTALQAGREPAAALRFTYNLVDTDKPWYATIVIATFDTKTRVLSYASAGHQPLLITTKGSTTNLDHTGTPFGLMEPDWYTRTIVVPPGGMITAFTDGVIEARNANREQFGLRRLIAAVEKTSGGTPSDTVTTVLKEMAEFTGRLDPEDDASVLSIKNI